MDKLDLMKVENFHCVNNTTKRIKREATDLESLFEITYVTKDLYPEPKGL